MAENRPDNAKRTDRIALVNILCLRRLIHRDLAWYAKECCSQDSDGASFRRWLSDRVSAKDISEAEALYRDAPPFLRRLLQQEELVSKYHREELSEVEQAAIPIVIQHRAQEVLSQEEDGKPPADRRARIVRLGMLAAAVLMIIAAEILLLPQVLTLRGQEQEKQSEPHWLPSKETAKTQETKAEEQRRQATEIANLRRAIRIFQLPCVDPEDTGLQDALPTIGGYIQETKAKNPELEKNSPEMCQQLQLLEKEYQVLKERFSSDGKTPSEGEM